MKKVLSIIAIALYMLIGIEQVNAEGDKYILDLIPYNVTTACDLEGDGGQACFEKYLKGELDSYRITNGKVAKDNIIMIIPEITPKTGSELTGIQVAILNDPKITTFYQSSYGAEYGTLKTSKANLGYVYDFFPTVTIMNGRDEIELQEWVSNGKPKVDKVSEGSFTSLMYNAGSNEDALAPLEKKTPLGATFYTINDNVTTEDIIFQYDPDRQETSISDVNGSNALLDEAEIRSVTLKITSSVSTDATLKELTATGSNNLAYPFTETFAPGKFEYYTIVPNVVDNIRFNGTPNDPKIQGATGLENISAATGISVLASSNGHDLNVGDNTVNIVVTAESGDTEVYKINVKRLSNDTTIKGVTGTNGVSFTSISNDPSVTNTTTVPYKTASTDITAEFNHEGATLKENLGTLTLNTDNENDTSTKFNIKVNSEECNYTDGSVPGLDETTCASATYPFEIIRTAPSKNVNLSELKVDNVTVPGFDPINDPDKVSFTLPDVSADKESVEVTATLADTLNTISGTGTHNLKVGDNAIKVTVLSEDGVTKKEYTINIKRLSNESKLAATDGLKVESTPTGTLAPNFVNTFDSSMGNYTYTFPANIENIKVTATALDTNKASVSIIDMSTSETIDNSDKTLNTTSKTFTKDTKKVGVIVTAEDGSTRVYKIDFSRMTSTNNLLKSLNVTPGTGIKETFVPTTTSYTAEVDPDVTEVTVNYETQDSNVKTDYITADGLTVNGNKVSGLKYGPNTIKVHVEAENGQPIDYTIVVTRKESSIATIDSLRVGYNGNTPTDITGFVPTTHSYNLSEKSSPIAYNTTSITIEYDKTNEEATVTGNVGTIDLTTFSGKKLVSDGAGKQVYEYTFTINVESQDHSNQETYTLIMYKEANNSTDTDTVTVHGVNATLDPSDVTNSTYKVEVGNNITSVRWGDINVTTNETTSVVTSITTGTLNLSTTSDSTFDYMVTAENGETKTYHIIITRKKSTDNTLTRVNLYLGEETTSTRFCEYTGNNTSCQIEVPTGTTKYRLEAILPSGATVSPDNTTEYTMGNTASDSTKTHTLTVKPEDETASSKDYTVVVKRLQSSNNLLDILETNANSDTLNDILGSDKVSPNHTVTVPSSQTTLTIHAVAADGTSKITSNKYTGVAGNDITFDVTDLKYGNNLVTITVTSELNVPKIYNLTVVREDNTEPRLSMITIDGNPIDDYLTGITFDADPSKDVNDTNYTYNLNMFDNSTSSIMIDATHMDTENGSFTGAGQQDIETIYYGTTFDSGTIYTNKIVIRSCAHNKSICKDYTLNITRASNSNVELGSTDVAMNYDGVDHPATWNSAENRYEITVPNKVTIANDKNVLVTVPTLPGNNDAKAKVTMNETTLKTDDETTNNVNIHKFTVTAEDGTQKEYTMQITRELSSNAYLQSISILNPDTNTDIGSWSPSFGNGIINYTVSVPVSTNEIKIDASIGESHQKIKDGDLGTFTLASSNETFNIEVTAENGDKITYILNIVREQSRINTLKSLKVKDLDGNEYTVSSHADERNKFSVTIPGTVDKIKLEAVSDSALAKIDYLDTDAGTNDTYSISKGTVTKKFTITSESGLVADYFVEVTKLPKTDTTLKKLSYQFNISDTPVEITLSDGVLEYNIPDVANDIKQIIVSGETNDSDASITSGNTTHALNTGENIIEVNTVAEDGTTKLTYKIKVTREKNGNAFLSTLSVLGYTFDEAIDLENTFDYTIHVDEDKEKLLASEITALAKEATSTVTLNDNDLTLVSGENTYHITVKAENDHEEHYTIKVVKPASTNALLKEVKVTGGSLKETFDPDIDTYTIIVPFGATTFEIEGIAEKAPLATVDGNGVKNVIDSPITLTVHPEDQNAPTKNYTFNVEVSASNEATLNSLSVTDHPFTDGTNEVTFNKDDEKYSIGDVNLSLDKVTVNAGITNANATVSYFHNGVEINSCNNASSCEITLATTIGTKKVEVKVLAADKVTSKTYEISYNKVASDNNSLQNIEAFDSENNQLSLSEPFNETIKEYTVNIPNDKDSVRIDITKSDEFASVTINGDAVNSKNFTNLPEGTTTVTIVVTSQSNVENPYTVNIERASYTASSDTELTDLKVIDVIDSQKEYALTPNFGSATDDKYSIGDIPFSLSSLKIEVSDLSTLKATAKYYVNDEEQSGNIITLGSTSGTIKVEVIAEDNTTTRTYEIAYTKTPSTNAYLSGITVSNGTLDPAFEKETYGYVVDVTNDIDAIDITADLEDSTAKITINGEVYTAGSTKTIDNLAVGENTITIVVTAEDGTAKTYEIKVNRQDVVDDEKITSVTYGHTIDDDYIKTVSDKTTAKDMKDQLDNDNSKLVIYKADGTTEVTDTELVGTGFIVKLIVDGVEKDSKVIIIRGDVNGDGEVELFDAADLINHYLDTNPLVGVYLIAGDVNKDGETELFDAADIINHYLDTAPIQFKD